MTDDEIDLINWFSYDPITGLISSPKGVVGRPHCKGYLRVHRRRKDYLAHRLAFFLHEGRWPVEVDHDDLDKTNNRWSNLREVTHQQNQFNQPLRSNNTSGFKGVSWNEKRKKYRARVVLNGRCHHAGFFSDPACAHEALKSLRDRLHGEYANHGGNRK